MQLFVLCATNTTSVGPIDNFSDTKLSSLGCFNRFKSELSTGLLARAVLLGDAVLIRDKCFHCPVIT